MSHDPESTIGEAEKITDVSDQATEVEERSRAFFLHNQRKLAKREQEPDHMGVYAITECVKCDDEIPTERLAVAIRNTFCVFCLAAEERLARR